MPPDPTPLPPIPFIDIAPGDEPAVATVAAEQARLALLLASARRSYTPIGLHVANSLSAAWARRAPGPYAPAVAAVNRAMGVRGAWLLNHSYEWGCSSAAIADPALGGMTLVRTLDWPFDGLGRALVVTNWQGQAGSYCSVTWPGFVGVLTGAAPSRFAAAINQPPLPLPRWGRAVGWPAARARVWRSAAMPPSQLLRLAFDTCRDFDSAVALLRTTPICLSAIFTVAGPRQGEAIVIERTPDHAFIAPEPAAANHWAATGSPAGRPRNASSRERRRAMCRMATSAPDWSLSWLQPPILQPDTRVAVMANPATGRLLVQGLEQTGPATEVLTIQ